MQYLLFQKPGTYLKIIKDGNVDDKNGYVTGSLGVCGNAAALSLRHGSQGEFIHTSVIRPIVIMMITSLVIITDLTPKCLLNIIKYRIICMEYLNLT